MLQMSLLRLLLCTLFILVSWTPRTSSAAVAFRFGIPDAACAMPITSPATTTYGTIRGTVTAEGKPVSGVLVRLISPGINMPIDATKTEIEGEYEFTDVAPGKYKITTQIAGCHDQASDVETLQGMTDVRDFNLAEPPPREQVFTENVTVSPRLGCVEGHVSDVKSAPGQATILCLIDCNRHIYAVTEPDAQGAFAFSLIPPGEYRLEFQHPNYPARRTFVSVSAGQTSHLTYSPSSGWTIPFIPFELFDPSRGGYVHLRGFDENNTWGVQPSDPDYETTAPAYGTAVLIR